jgi:hypothetical protein
MSKQDEWMFFKGNVINFPIPEGVKTPIYVIGDSHVRVLPQACPYIFKGSGADIADVFESKSAYAVGTEGHDLYLKECLRLIPDGSTALLSFGEIDCRHYSPKKAIENNSSIEIEVDVVIDRYTSNCVRLLKDKFRVMILGPYICPEDHAHANKFEDIVIAKTYFNSRIKKYCEDNGILYVPIFKKSLEEKWDEQPTYTYFNDSSHLGPCMVPVILDSMSGFKWKGYDY